MVVEGKCGSAKAGVRPSQEASVQGTAAAKA